MQDIVYVPENKNDCVVMDNVEISIDPYRELTEHEVLDEMERVWKAQNLWPCCLCLKQPKIYIRTFTWWERFKRLFNKHSSEYIHIDCDCAKTWIYDLKPFPQIEQTKFMWNFLNKPKVEEAVRLLRLYGFHKGYEAYRFNRDNFTELDRIRYSPAFHYVSKPLLRNRRCDDIHMAMYL